MSQEQSSQKPNDSQLPPEQAQPTNNLHSLTDRVDQVLGKIIMWSEDFKRANWVKLCIAILGVIGSILVLVEFYDLGDRFQSPAIEPMPLGAPNVIIAGIGVMNSKGVIAADDERGEAMSQRVWEILSKTLDDGERGHLRKFGEQNVGYITGATEEERQSQAATIADKHRASVIVYGVIRPLDGRKAIFYPEFYVNLKRPETQVEAYGQEITDIDQLGEGIIYDTTDWEDSSRESLKARINKLNLFIRGLQKYIDADGQAYASASQSFCAALGFDNTTKCATTSPIGSASPSSVNSVIFLFLGAIAVKEQDYQQAFAYSDLAHEAWPSYPRPYLTRGAILAQIGLKNINVPASPSQASADPTAQTSCFGLKQLPVMSAAEYLSLAQICFEEAVLSAETMSQVEQRNNMHIDLKAKFSQASLLLMSGIHVQSTSWPKAEQLFSDVIEYYEQHLNNPQEVIAIRELVANAYARRGVVRYCAQTTPCLQGSTASDARVDPAITADFSAAIRLLRLASLPTTHICDLLQKQMPNYYNLFASTC